MALDLHPAATTVAGLIRALPEEALAGPTPCPDYTVGDLVDHVHSFCLAFTAAAIKEPLDRATDGPTASASLLGDDWRERVPRRLEELAQAWSDPAAWTGMTAAGGLDLPGEVAGLFALDELVVHGWDLAAATGQAYEPAEGDLAALQGFLVELVGDGAPREGLFGAPVTVRHGAPGLHQVLGLTGRDPGWTP